MAYCFTASPTSHPESKTLHLIIYDESQDLDDHQVKNAIKPMGAAVNATEVFIGVAGYRRCQFWEMIETFPLQNKIIVPYQKALQERQELYNRTNNVLLLNYQKHIDKQKRDYGLDSDEVRTQYELIWVLERGQFITFEDLMKLESEFLLKEVWTRQDREVVGIDWGKMHDSTVVTFLGMSGHIDEWIEFEGDDYSSQIKDIIRIIQTRHQGTYKIECDSTGTQDMALDWLKDEIRNAGLNIVVEGVKFNPETKDFMYKNLSKLMHNVIMNNQVITPSFIKFPKRFSVQKERFIKQFLDLQKEIKNDKWRCNHPEGPIYHDDYCDSLALACKGLVQEEKRQGYQFCLG
jgi:hypothetical protein